MKFEDIASYDSAAFDGILNLKSAQISTMLLDGASFGKNSKIDLKDADFKRLKAPWNEIKDLVVYDPRVYLALIDNYRIIGWPSDEDDCYYTYRRLNQADKGFRVFEGHRRFSMAVLRLRCSARLHCDLGDLNHPRLCLIFWKEMAFADRQNPYKALSRRTQFRKEWFSAMLCSSVPASSSLKGRSTFADGKAQYYVIVEGILGWLLALFLVTLGRIMIR